jgi:hypothetical protein
VVRDDQHQRIVAVGLLTAADLDVLGTGFKRVFPIDDDAAFDDLLAQLDALTPEDDAPVMRTPNAR